MTVAAQAARRADGATPFSAAHLHELATEAEAERTRAFEERLAPEAARVKRILDHIELDAYREELANTARAGSNLVDRQSHRKMFSHLLMDEAPDSELLPRIVSDVINPWIRDRLCRGTADHGFRVEKDGTRLMLKW